MKNNPGRSSCENCSSKSNNIFRNLTAEEHEILALDKNIEPHKKGSVIYHEGNRISGCYCVSNGIIKIYKTGIDGKEQIITFAKAGDLIGFRSVLSGELACTTAKVIEDAHLCFIPADTLIHLVKKNGEFSMDLMQLACKELGESNAYITDIAQKTVRERLAEVLLHLKDNFGLDDDQFLKITLTREELSNIVGTATESVIRLLSEFKSDGLIELHGRRIKLLNIPGLKKTGNVF
jgi:CRP/FNR family transcriptional regulator, polysaccharide utilization system transcription regulator